LLLGVLLLILLLATSARRRVLLFSQRELEVPLGVVILRVQPERVAVRFGGGR
jgi:uncharacterized integral membrane protein